MTINKDFLKALGRHIDIIRKAKGISFQELADYSDIEKANLVKLTSHGSNITISTLYNIAKGLNVSVKELLDFEVPTTKE